MALSPDEAAGALRDMAHVETCSQHVSGDRQSSPHMVGAVNAGLTPAGFFLLPAHFVVHGGVGGGVLILAGAGFHGV